MYRANFCGRLSGAGRLFVREDRDVEEKERKELQCANSKAADAQESDILEEIEVEDFAVDGICGVY